MQLENGRNLQDASFTASTTLPATNNSNVTTTSFNLIQSFATSEHYVATISIDPLANYGTSGVLTATIQDSADNVNFANISTLGSVSINANTTTATVVPFKFSPSVRQYVRAIAAMTTNNGNIAANNITFSIEF